MYGERFGTDWESIDVDEAIERAYALGVAEVLGERHDDEYERLEAVTDSAYERSMLELSYEDGKKEARGLEADDGEVWARLVEDEEPDGETVEPESPEDDEPTDSRSAVSRTDAIERHDADSTDAVDKPDFLERD